MFIFIYKYRNYIIYRQIKSITLSTYHYKKNKNTKFKEFKELDKHETNILNVYFDFYIFLVKAVMCSQLLRTLLLNNVIVSFLIRLPSYLLITWLQGTAY